MIFLDEHVLTTIMLIHHLRAANIDFDHKMGISGILVTQVGKPPESLLVVQPFVLKYI